MDDTSKTFMRGDAKNARASELLARLKAERDVTELESREIPNTLEKRPLLPAIRKTREEDSLYYSENETSNFPVTQINTRFLWKDLDWEESTHATKTWEIENNRARSKSLIKQKSFNSTENAAKNLPPLRTRKLYSQGVVRPGRPEPPFTACFDENSHDS